MSGTGKAAVLVSAVVVLAMVMVAGAQQGEPKAPPAVAPDASHLAFLEVGKVYAIRFAPGADPFMFRTSEVGQSEVSSTPAGGGGKTTTETIPSTVTMTYRVPEFTVKKLGGGSWALLEFPLDVKAATERSLARLALKNKEMLAGEEKTKDGRKRIAEWKEEAARKVATTEAWVNLAHAVIIAPPLVDPKDPRLEAISISVEIK